MPSRNVTTYWIHVPLRYCRLTNVITYLLDPLVRVAHFGDGGVTAASARIVATVSAVPQCVLHLSLLTSLIAKAKDMSFMVKAKANVSSRTFQGLLPTQCLIIYYTVLCRPKIYK